MTLSIDFLIAVFVLLILPVIGLALDSPAMFGRKSYAEVSRSHIGLIVYGMALSAFFAAIAMIAHGFGY